MFTLIKFELKKLLGRRVAQVACIGILAMLAGVMALNVVQQKTSSSDGEIISGTEAIACRHAADDAHAGELTPERVAADVRTYMETVFSQVDPEDVVDLSDAAAYQLMLETYPRETRAVIFDSYYSYLLSPWNPGGREPYQVAADLIAQAGSAEAAAQQAGQAFSGAIAAKVQDSLDDGMRGTWTYSDAERAFWTDKQEQVAEPLAYGYADGWDDILNCVAFLAFAMVAVCVALAPIFAGEYQQGADAVLLASRYGRTKLVVAKLAAAFVFTTAYFALATAIIVGVALAFFGADGAGLPVQAMSLSIPYNLTMAQATAAALGLAYLMALGFAALTLALSALFRSILAVFALDVALIFITGLLPTGGNGVLMHIQYLFPLNTLVPSPLLSDMVSYPLGPVVVGLIGMAALVYAVVLLVCAPASALVWRRHQVA